MSAVFDVEKLISEVTLDRRYHEFLRISTLSSGLYVLVAGATDKQSPHKEDEIYYVVRGKAKIRISGSETPVVQGSVIFIEANAEHRFFDIEEELVLLVFFAPPESS